jgi:hypothetical protein
MGAHGFARGTTIARALAVLLAATVLGATSRKDPSLRVRPLGQ